MSWRERRLKKDDTSGYSEGETVYVAMTDPNEVSESTEPEAEDKKSNEQLNSPVTAVDHETISAN